MTNPFASFTTDGLEQSKDTLGGGFQPVESDIYPMLLTMMFTGQASGDSKAQSVTVHGKLDMGDGNSRDYRETIWVSKRTGEHYSVKDGKKVPMVGFTTVDELCLLSTGFPLAQQTFEEKQVMLYDFNEKKEVPKNVMVVTSALGKMVKVGILKRRVNKQEKGADGKYVDTPDTRDENVIDKVFHAEENRTVSEFRESKGAAFHDMWLDKNKGQLRDQSKTVAGGGGKAGRPGASQAGQAGAPSAASLFNKGS